MKTIKLSKKTKNLRYFLCNRITSPLCGCIQTLSLISIPLTAIQLGTMAYQSIEEVDISATLASGVTEKELHEIKNIAILLGDESDVTSSGKVGELKAVLRDNLCVQLTNIGFMVCDGSQLERSTSNNWVETGYNINNMVEAGRALGVQAIVNRQCYGSATQLVRFNRSGAYEYRCSKRFD